MTTTTAMKEHEEDNVGRGNGNHGETLKEKLSVCYGLKHVNRTLVQCFYSLGYHVGLRPSYFIIIPLIISAVLSTGLIFIQYEENPMVLFVPFTAPFIREQRIVEAHFPMNYSYYFDPIRFTRHEGHSRIIVSAKDDRSILRSKLWPEIMDLDERIRNITITNESGEELDYEELCAKWRGRCIENFALNINKIIGEIENGTNVISLPIMLVPFIVPQLLGGVEVNETAGTVVDAKAILIAYFIELDTKEDAKISNEWEFKLLNLLKNLDYKYIRASFYASRSLQDELKVKMDSCIPYIPVTGIILVTACMVLLWMSDCIRSKPWIGVVGIISSIMATGAAFGVLIYCGAIYTRLNVVAFFLVLGIGVDDIFVAISAWQKTSMSDSVPKRLAQTYSDAAVSVTITSLTNALAFAVGVSTPTLIVKAFCLYSCFTIFFAYLWFVTFCGGFLALAGYMEEQDRHAFFLVKVKEPREEDSPWKKKFYSIICSSSSRGLNTERSTENSSYMVSIFFRDYVGSLLCNTKFKIFSLVSLLLYLSGAIYGLTVLREGLYRHRMSRDDSYLAEFSHRDNRYFRHLPYSIQVVVTGNVTYSDPETQKKLMDLEKQFEALPYGSDPLYTQSWLRSFLKRLRRKKDWQKQITDEKSFIKVLREKYFVNPDNTLRLDIEFNDDYSRILASRMIFQAANVKDVYDDVLMMNSYREVAEKSGFNVTCFHLLFSLFDQHSMMKPMAIQSILIAVVVVVIVALLFIPDVRGSFAIAFSIISIATGVIGYMAFWDINLDHVSAGSIFMCIGFSVDFSAHITYTYLSSKEKTTEGRIRDSMFSLGYPILQGGLTTILSLVSFLMIPGYGYRTFFKTIFLVTIFAAYHSIILIPLFLSKWDDLTRFMKDRRRRAREAHAPGAERNGSAKQTAQSNGLSKTPYFNGQPLALMGGRRSSPDSVTVLGIRELSPEGESPSSCRGQNGAVGGCEPRSANGSVSKARRRSEGEDEEKGVDNKAFSDDDDAACH